MFSVRYFCRNGLLTGDVPGYQALGPNQHVHSLLTVKGKEFFRQQVQLLNNRISLLVPGGSSLQACVNFASCKRASGNCYFWIYFFHFFISFLLITTCSIFISLCQTYSKSKKVSTFLLWINYSVLSFYRHISLHLRLPLNPILWTSWTQSTTFLIYSFQIINLTQATIILKIVYKPIVFHKV